MSQQPILETSVWVIINERGSVRHTKNAPSTRADEVALKVSFKLPKALFARPVVRATVTVDEKAIAPKDISPEVLVNTATLIEQSLGMKVELAVIPPEDPEE